MTKNGKLDRTQQFMIGAIVEVKSRTFDRWEMAFVSQFYPGNSKAEPYYVTRTALYRYVDENGDDVDEEKVTIADARRRLSLSDIRVARLDHIRPPLSMPHEITRVLVRNDRERMIAGWQDII